LENARLYIQDAQTFLEDGQDEVAILSIGYADGLVDALRLAMGLNPKM
jgi:diphthine synthase